MSKALVRREISIAARILQAGGQRVMLDADLASVYGVPTKALNQAVKRNRGRFPRDFAFQLTPAGFSGLRSQIVTSNIGRGGRRTRPWVFTEHGAMMAASILNSPRAIEMSVFVVRAFVRMRNVVRTHVNLAARLSTIEKRVGRHDHELRHVIAALRELLSPPAPARRPIGFAPPPPQTSGAPARRSARRGRRPR